MPRPKNPVQPERVEIRINPSIVRQMDFFLARDFKGKVKLGERGRLIESLLRKWLDDKAVATIHPFPIKDSQQ